MLNYQFGSSSTANSLVLNNIYLLAGNWDGVQNRLIAPNPKTHPYMKMPPLCISLVKRTQKESGFYMCPMFKSAPSSDNCSKNDRIRIDGEINNFIRYIPVKTDEVDKQLIASGTCFVCHPPQSFS